MNRDELVACLVQLPGQSDIVVEVGGLHLDITALRYVRDRDRIVLSMEPDDVRDAVRRVRDGPVLHRSFTNSPPGLHR